jgi:tRNA pseudouridine38-40 synthase
VRNIKLTIEYDGKNYRGWQVQKSHQVIIRFAQDAQSRTLKRQRSAKTLSHLSKTIQETIEQTLQKILQEKIKLIGSGRTDAGVHALAQIANFKTKSNISLDRLLKALNGLLPLDISIARVEEKNLNFHSRFDTKSKIYRYTLLNRKYRSAFLRNTAYFYPHPLNTELMRKESKVLLGRHNFKSFQASDKKTREVTRTIKKIDITKDKDLILIDIEADGFLYNMVRNIVGTLIEIGRGRFSKGSLNKILHSQNRGMAGPTVPAKGLCLLKVKY